MILATKFLAETGQEEDPAELVEARNIALARQALFSSCIPTMAWNYYSGDMEAFYAQRFAQVDDQMHLLSLKMYLHHDLSALQQWQLQRPGNALVRERSNGVNRR
jgi:hypothetical protein